MSWCPFCGSQTHPKESWPCRDMNQAPPKPLVPYSWNIPATPSTPPPATPRGPGVHPR